MLAVMLRALCRFLARQFQSDNFVQFFHQLIRMIPLTIKKVNNIEKKIPNQFLRTKSDFALSEAARFFSNLKEICVNCDFAISSFTAT